LHTVAEGKPLNFLDHHLKVGNSLIGAWVDDLASLPVPRKRGPGKEAEAEVRQLNLFETRLHERLPVMLNKVLEIIRRRSDTLEDIKAKAAADQAVEQLRVPFKAVADLWVSTYFGSEVSEGEYQQALEHIGEPMQLLGLPSVRQADRVARDKHFFHWELEFPEVFYKDSTRQGNPGFDAILGNPPYVDSEEMTQSQPQLREYCTRRYGSAVGNWDLFVVFVELGITLSRRGGRSSLIVPNKLLGSEYCVGVHSLLRQKQVKVLRDYSRVRVFESSVYPVVYVVQNTVGSPTDVIELSQMSEGDQSRRPVEIRRGSATLEVLDRLPPGYWWPVFSPAFPVVRKALTVSWDLDQVARVVGAATVSEAYELADLVEDDAGPTTSTDSAVDRFKLLNTGTIDRYDCKWGLAPTTYLKNTYQHPVVQGPKLAQVSDTRLDQARSRKVILAGMSTRLEGFCDVDGTYLPGKSTVVLLDCLVDEQYLLAILNSTLCSLVYREVFGSLALQGGYLRVGPPQAARIPVRRIRFTTPAEERQRLAAHAEALFSIGDQAELIAFTSERLARAPEQADVIHDLLAHLAQQMTDMNREKNAEVKGFLDWLARYTGLPTEEWRLKTVVQAYWQHSWDELLRALGENRKAIEKDSGRNVDSRQVLETIEREFEQSMARLAPLLERIAWTDRLIDLIVYRLYGLTEEEVAIIEGGV
jgi:hypothetical protein